MILKLKMYFIWYFRKSFNIILNIFFQTVNIIGVYLYDLFFIFNYYYYFLMVPIILNVT